MKDINFVFVLPNINRIIDEYMPILSRALKKLEESNEYIIT